LPGALTTWVVPTIGATAASTPRTSSAVKSTSFRGAEVEQVRRRWRVDRHQRGETTEHERPRIEVAVLQRVGGHRRQQVEDGSIVSGMEAPGFGWTRPLVPCFELRSRRHLAPTRQVRAGPALLRTRERRTGVQSALRALSWSASTAAPGERTGAERDHPRVTSDE